MSLPQSCKRVYRFICENLDQTMDSPRCRAIRKHLDDCPDCRTYLDSLKKTVVLYTMLPSPKVPNRVHRKLFRTIALAYEAGGKEPRRPHKRILPKR